MNIKYLLLFILLFVLYCPVQSQQEFGLLKLKVFSEETHTPLQNAYVYFDNKIAICDDRGELSLELKSGYHEIRIEHIGYQSIEKRIHVFADSVNSLIIKLEPKPIQLQSIQVEADLLSPDRKMMKMGPGFHRIDGTTILSSPVSLEPELLRVLSQLPGVHTTNELTTQLNVRGGTPDQNIFLLNGMRLFNLYHMVGINGVIQPELIENVFFSSAAFPACYGNGLSSIIDVETPKPDKRLRFSGGLSSVSSRIKTTLPITKHTALTLAARHTYWNLILGKQLPYYFTDLFFDLQQELGKKHYFQATFFSSRDVFDRNSDSQRRFNPDSTNSIYKYFSRRLFKWNTSSGLARWKYVLANNFSSDVIISYSEMTNNTDVSSRAEILPDLSKDYYGQLYELNASKKANANKSDNQFNSLLFSSKLNLNKLQFGFEAENRTFNYRWQNLIEDETIKLFFDNAPDSFAYNSDQQNLSGFFDWLWEPVQKLKFRTGLRASWSFDYPRPYWEPRFTGQYVILPHITFSMGYSHHVQTIATARERGLLGFLDLYFPLRDKPETADHFAAEIKWELPGSNEIILAAYQKYFKDLLYADSSFNRQSGSADGLEVSWLHKGKKFNLNAFYTYAQIFREIANYRYHSNFDIRHRLFIESSYILSKRWKFSLTYHFHTGQPYDPGRLYNYYGRELSFYFPDNQPVYNAILQDETDIPRGSIRYPDYSRMDITLFYAFKIKRMNVNAFLSVINVLNTKNLITYDFLDFPIEAYETSSTKLPVLNYSLVNVERLPFLPSVGIQWSW